VKVFRRSERGFTLVELLIAMVILSIIAAIAVPTAISLIGGSETKAGEAELANVQAAVDAMMADQGLSRLPNPVTTATSNMSKFPDWESDLVGGYVLYPGTTYKNKDAYGNPDADKFMRTATTKGTYTCAADGQVTQVTTGYE